MDFVIGLPQTQRQHDAIWAIVDRLKKSSHFLPVNVENSMEKLAQLYVDEIVRLQGVPGLIFQIETLGSHPGFGPVCRQL